MKKEHVYYQHTENQEWMIRVLFYQDELRILTSRLEEIAGDYTSNKEVLTGIEHFQNQFIIQKEQLDLLKHEIDESDRLIYNEILKNEVASDHRTMKDHSEIRENIESFERIFKSLREEFNQFLSKWM